MESTFFTVTFNARVSLHLDERSYWSDSQVKLEKPFHLRKLRETFILNIPLCEYT